jgi:hypothetical protein
LTRILSVRSCAIATQRPCSASRVWGSANLRGAACSPGKSASSDPWSVLAVSRRRRQADGGNDIGSVVDAVSFAGASFAVVLARVPRWDVMRPARSSASHLRRRDGCRIRPRSTGTMPQSSADLDRCTRAGAVASHHRAPCPRASRGRDARRPRHRTAIKTGTMFEVRPATAGCRHAYGEGPFCRFTIPTTGASARGVYAIVVDDGVDMAERSGIGAAVPS